MSLAFEHIKEQIWKLLSRIEDPELPVLSIVDIGVVRDVIVDENSVKIKITPTYSGCPAMNFFKEEIQSILTESGYTNVEIKVVYIPTWSSECISEQSKLKLKKYGIAPPEESDGKICCPICDSDLTELISNFGSTACKALYKCKNCIEPFEYFKCI